MSIRKRTWVGPGGEAKFAWVVDFKDLGGARRLRTFRLKKEAERYHTKVRAELLDAELKAKGPAALAGAPDHGSNPIPSKDEKMNSSETITRSAETPAPSAEGKIERDRSAPEYAEAWGRCRRLGEELSQALADTGDVEFGFILPAGLECAVSFGQLQDDTRHTAEFPMQTINRLAGRIALMLGDDPKLQAERVIITERGVQTIIKLPGFTDPLVEAIEAYEAGVARFNAIPEAEVTVENEDNLVSKTYRAEMERLLAWDGAATSREGAIAALKFMGDQRVFCDAMGEPMRLAVLRYLEAM